jgi:hypothetical protein
MAGVIDFITLCNIGIFFNVLDSRTYGSEDETEDDTLLIERYDCNTIPDDDRRKFVYARGLSLELLHWLGTKCIVFDNENNEATEIKDIQELHMTRLGAYMLQYLDEWIIDASRMHDPVLPFLDNNSLKKQLQWAIITVPWFPLNWFEEEMKYYSLHCEYPRSVQPVPHRGDHLRHVKWCKLLCFLSSFIFDFST